MAINLAPERPFVKYIIAGCSAPLQLAPWISIIVLADRSVQLPQRFSRVLCIFPTDFKPIYSLTVHELIPHLDSFWNVLPVTIANTFWQ